MAADSRGAAVNVTACAPASRLIPMQHTPAGERITPTHAAGTRCRGGKPVRTAPGRSRVPGTPRRDASLLVSGPGFPVQRGAVWSGRSITPP